MMNLFTEDLIVHAGLGAILLIVLMTPFVSSGVEKNLEPFLFFMGLSAVLLTRTLSTDLIVTSLVEPLPISFVVLLTGVLFSLGKKRMGRAIIYLSQRIPPAILRFFLVLMLGLSSSIITAIIASLILVEVITHLNLDGNNRLLLNVLACFAIGLGSALTPLGEPLSTIATSKLGVDFFYILRTLGIYIIPGIFFIAALAAICVRTTRNQPMLLIHGGLNINEAIPRALRVYVFILALILLGEGFSPLIDRYLISRDGSLLYWFNLLSAVLDNATLTAAELTPAMDHQQVCGCLMGLLLSGGMLIPGNIPNIITAGRLGISSSQWARIGVPLGLGLMIFYYIILF